MIALRFLLGACKLCLWLLVFVLSFAMMAIGVLLGGKPVKVSKHRTPRRHR